MGYSGFMRFGQVGQRTPSFEYRARLERGLRLVVASSFDDFIKFTHKREAERVGSVLGRFFGLVAWGVSGGTCGVLEKQPPSGERVPRVRLVALVWWGLV